MVRFYLDDGVTASNQFGSRCYLCDADLAHHSYAYGHMPNAQALSYESSTLAYGLTELPGVHAETKLARYGPSNRSRLRGKKPTRTSRVFRFGKNMILAKERAEPAPPGALEERRPGVEAWAYAEDYVHVRPGPVRMRAGTIFKKAPFFVYCVNCNAGQVVGVPEVWDDGGADEVESVADETD